MSSENKDPEDVAEHVTEELPAISEEAVPQLEETTLNPERLTVDDHKNDNKEVTSTIEEQKVDVSLDTINTEEVLSSVEEQIDSDQPMSNINEVQGSPEHILSTVDEVQIVSEEVLYSVEEQIDSDQAISNINETQGSSEYILSSVDEVQIVPEETLDITKEIKAESQILESKQMQGEQNVSQLVSVVKEPCNGPDQILPAGSHKTWIADGTVGIPITESGPASSKPLSVHTLLKNQAEDWPEHHAMAVKRGGVWKYWTYKDYYEQSRTVAKAFIKLGLERFHGVCIMGFNSPEWMISNFGCILAGGLSAGVYTTNLPEACRHLADNCRAQIVVVENQECLDKFLAVKRFLPQIKAIVQWSGVPGAPDVLSWAEVLAIGKHEHDAALDERLSLQAVNQCCTLIYTSGTTGPPKGVMCSQDHLTWAGARYAEFMSLSPGYEVIVSYLPMSHLAAQALDGYLAISTAATVYFAQPDALKGSLGDTLKEVQPTVFLGVPRVWEKIYEKMQEVSAQNTGLKRVVANWAKYHGLNYYMAMLHKTDLSFIESYKHAAAKYFLLDKVREAIGFNRATKFCSGSAPIAKEILQYYLSIDLPVMEGYALSESLAICSMCHAQTGQFRLGSVGKIQCDLDVKLEPCNDFKEDEGEILIRGRNVCMGYLGMEDKTNETIDDEGWLHSGDIGRFDTDGFLYITGRIKELVITAGGENIPPVLIEEKIKKQIPFISNCMLIGDNRKYLSVLLALKADADLDTGMPMSTLMPGCVSDLRSLGSSAVTVQEVLQEVEDQPNGAIATAINSGIKRYNEHHAISSAQRVQRWRLLPNEFSLPTGELNNTLKLKRSFVLTKYKDLIDEMYEEKQVLSKL